MSPERPRLARALVGSVLDHAGKESLRRVAEEARRRIAHCDAVGVTLVGEDAPTAAVGTARLARQLDRAQCRAGRGPGLDAIRQLQVFNVASLDGAGHWPEFGRAALRRGIRSSLSVPLTVGGARVGVLNLYSRRPGAFSGCEPLGLSYAARAALVLAEAIQGGAPEAGRDSSLSRVLRARVVS